MKSSALADALLGFVFRAVVPDYGSTLHLSLHESDPGTSSDQTTGETTYPGYARVAVARDTSGNAFTVTGGAATNAITATFPVSSGGPNTLTHWGIGAAGNGETTGAAELAMRKDYTATDNAFWAMAA